MAYAGGGLWIALGAVNSRRASTSRFNDSEQIAALGAGVQDCVDQVLPVKGGEGSSERAVAGCCLVGGLCTVDGSEGLLCGTFVSRTAGSEEVRDSDRGDNTDNRNNDEKLD